MFRIKTNKDLFFGDFSQLDAAVAEAAAQATATGAQPAAGVATAAEMEEGQTSTLTAAATDPERSARDCDSGQGGQLLSAPLK